MSEAATVASAPPAASDGVAAPLLTASLPAPAHQLDLASRAHSDDSVLSQDSTSGTGSEPAGSGLVSRGSGGSSGHSLGLQQCGSAASTELEAAAAAATAGQDGSAGEQQQGGSGGAGHRASCSSGGTGHPKKDIDAKSSALKALAGVSAIVSKSRKVDAEALQAIKSQRAKARAEGHTPGSLASAASLPAPGAGAAAAAGRATPPPPASLASGDVGGASASLSPFASATSQGLVRTPSSSNLTGNLAGSGGPPSGGALAQATSLPISMHSSQPLPRGRRSTSTPPASAADFEALVSKMTITELVALKQAVEGQLAKQALALAQLQASSQHTQQPDMLSQQYAALLLQNAQQAQLVQQLSSQQQAAHAAAIQQALSATASAAGITSPSFSPEQLLLAGAGAHPGAAAGGGGPGGPSAYPAMASLQDMSSPFATAAYPPESGFALADAGARSSVSLPARTFTAGTGTGPGSKSSGSPRSASAEQQLIGEALHSFVDPERQGPPSRQGSALVNGINWSDRRALGAMGAGAGGPPPGAFARSRSLPHPQEGALYHDRSASLNQYLGDGGDHQQLPSLFNSLRIAETLQQQQQAAAADGGGGLPPSAFARSGSLQVPLSRGGGGSTAQALGAMSPPHVVFADSLQQARAYQPGY